MENYEAGKMHGPSGDAPRPRLVSEGGEPVPSPLAACDSTSSPESGRGQPSPTDLVTRLRQKADQIESERKSGVWGEIELMREAASQIERLQKIEAAARTWRTSMECDDWTQFMIEQDVTRPGMSELMKLVRPK